MNNEQKKSAVATDRAIHRFLGRAIDFTVEERRLNGSSKAGSPSRCRGSRELQPSDTFGWAGRSVDCSFAICSPPKHLWPKRQDCFDQRAQNIIQSSPHTTYSGFMSLRSLELHISGEERTNLNV